MATTNSRKSVKSTVSKTTTPTNETQKSSHTTEIQKEKPIIPKEIDVTQIIPVMNGFQGRLIYKSPRTSERFVWDSFQDIQEIELRELRNAKSSAKSFFINNWFMFDDEHEWVIDYLGVGQYYKNALKLNEFDAIFQKSPEEIEKTVSLLSVGQKNSLEYRTRQLLTEGEIDSNKVIRALEKALGTELTER